MADDVYWDYDYFEEEWLDRYPRDKVGTGGQVFSLGLSDDILDWESGDTILCSR